MYADIIIDISHEKLDKTFQYQIPEELEDKVTEGALVIIPFGNGNKKIRGYVLSLSEKPKIEPQKIKPILKIEDTGIPIEGQLIRLAGWMKKNYGATMNQALKTVIPVRKKAGEKEEKRLMFLLSEKESQEELSVLTAKKRYSEAKKTLLSLFLTKREILWEQATKQYQIPAAVIREFEKKGWLRVQTTRSYRNPLSSIKQEEKTVVLNEQQKTVIRTVQRDREQKISKTYLLHGVTGSGKTEVYMELIDMVIREKKEVIVLIPEISLTYQTVRRFYSRFQDRVSIMNSRLSQGERYDQFERAKNGECQIMVGPRSALFTPFSNLGLIIIDEEHENSYKSETVPSYHARETAIERARLAGASVILGSATPSVESYKRAMDGDYTLLQLTRRVENKKLPKCEIVDLRQELKEGNRSIISRELARQMATKLEKKQQIMLFLNRRGMMGFVSCRSCGKVIRCPHCDVSLSLHKNGYLYCHYCGYKIPMPDHCPSCQSHYIGGFKVGTEKTESIVKKMFPEATVLRMDADTTRGKNGHQKILRSFMDHKADILIGTQMIVKGHDFPGVTLMGILAADMSLNDNDYRSAERTFQLLTQAAGRAGRGEEVGDVIIQTYQPENYSIVAAASQDYLSFYQQEMAYRTMMGYPPIQHMLLITMVSVIQETAVLMAEKIARIIGAADPKLQINGPQDAKIAKLKDQYRQVIYLKDSSYERLIAIKDTIEKWLLNEELTNKAYVYFDFDPMNSL